MKKDIKIESIMTKKVITCDINQSLKDVNHLFAKHHIRHIPIVSDDLLVGIMSKTDLNRISFSNTYGEEQEDADEAVYDLLSINQVMKHSPVTVTADQTVKDAASIFVVNEFHALPVTENQQLIGIITTTDIIKLFLSL